MLFFETSSPFFQFPYQHTAFGRGQGGRFWMNSSSQAPFLKGLKSSSGRRIHQHFWNRPGKRRTVPAPTPDIPSDKAWTCNFDYWAVCAVTCGFGHYPVFLSKKRFSPGQHKSTLAMAQWGSLPFCCPRSACPERRKSAWNLPQPLKVEMGMSHLTVHCIGIESKCSLNVIKPQVWRTSGPWIWVLFVL